MKLICDGLDLSDAVLKVLKATATRSTNPILEGIKIKAEGDVLTLSATDLELSIENKITADVKIEGEVVVPGKFFSEFIKKLTNEKIEISKNDKENLLKIKYTDSEGFIQCMPANEFPEPYALENPEYFEIKQKDFKDMINRTIFSASFDDARPILKGVLLEVENGKITCVALDGYRMAICSKLLLFNSAEQSFIVPARCLSEISKIIDDSDNSMKVYIQRNVVRIDLGKTQITSRLLDGDFINYRQVIPSTVATTIVVTKTMLEDSLERAILLARTNKNNLVTFDIKDKTLKISSDSNIGNIVEKITINIEGKDLLIAFNARYFSECLRYIEDEFIKINFTSPIAPCTITSSDSDKYLYLILPVKIIQ